MDGATLLIVEDDPVIRTFLADNLTADGYDLLVAGTIAEAVRELEYRRPDLAVVDLRLPDGSGLELIRRVRAADGISSRLDPTLPLIVLSGCGGELDRMRGFERGVDDYVVKPFAYGELRLRIAAVLRRSQARAGRGILQVGELRIDPAARLAALRGRRLRLAAKEFALLRMLASDPTRVFTKEELLREVWGFRAIGSTRTLDSHACRLRQKLRVHGDQFLVNVWGVGYRLVDGPERAVAEPTREVVA
jgi:DNA-binding response OmpR family regulator